MFCFPLVQPWTRSSRMASADFRGAEQYRAFNEPISSSVQLAESSIFSARRLKCEFESRIVRGVRARAGLPGVSRNGKSIELFNILRVAAERSRRNRTIADQRNGEAIFSGIQRPPGRHDEPKGSRLRGQSVRGRRFNRRDGPHGKI